MVILPALLLPTALAAGPKLTFEGAPRHPTVNVTPAEVERARRRIQTDPLAKAWFASIKRASAQWDDKDPAWVRSVMPGEGACFAYGFTGCPICGGRWSAWGGARCRFDKPGQVRCSNGHLLPDKQHPDPGTGYKGKDGRIHYFVGSYNAWVVETLIFKIARPYAKVYLLTGDERAGRMAAVILDEIARIYPSCDKGSWDYPSNPPSGRLNRPWYQVARVLVHFVDIYDWIYDHKALDEPSSRAGLTRRQNIEKHLLLNGAAYCYERSVVGGGLHNGQADYLRGVLAVGVVLGIPEYVTWPVDGTYGIRTMMANNVDRDGRYFETAAGYALHTRNLYLTFSEPLLNYRGSAYPNGLNLYDLPRFESFYVLPQMATVCLGHDAPFGDASPVRVQRKPPYHPSMIWDCQHTEYLATRLSDPAKRARYAALLADLRTRDPDVDRRLPGMVEWRVYHGPDDGPAAGQIDDRMKRYLDGSFFFGQKGLAVLRLGKDATAQAAILRFGPSLNHGHYDDLNVNFFARGYEMSYDIGYSLGSTHTQVGWAKQTISHNTVVVDERSHGGGQFGGSLHHFVDLPGLALAEGSSNVYAHAGVSVYRRLIGLVDGYALDVFRVEGGRQHDLPFHSLATGVSFENLTMGSPQAGSLAGKQHRWGELQLNDGDMKGYPSKPYWNPPPGNGYGFLSQPTYGKPTGNWSATWAFKDRSKTRFRLMALHSEGTEVAAALAPGLYPSFPEACHVIRRRKGDALSSCFVSVWQSFAGDGTAPVKSIRRIGPGTRPGTAGLGVALAVDLDDGRRDLWALAPNAEKSVAGADHGVPFATQGAIARCRVKGRVLLAAQLVDATRLSWGGWTLTLDAPSRQAKVVALPGMSRTIRIDPAWPADGRYNGDPVYVSNARYSRNTAYTVDQATGDRLGIEQAGTVLGQGVVAEIKDTHTLITRVPHEYARPVTRRDVSGIFQGKLLRTADGRTQTRIKDIRYGGAGVMTIDVDSTDGLKPGQTFHYHDVQPGDAVTVQHCLSLTHIDDRRYTLRTNTDATVVPPGGARVTYVGKSGQARSARAGKIPRADLSALGETTISISN